MNKWRLYEYMEKAGHNQSSLAKATGMSKNTIGKKLNGKASFTTVEIEKVCKVLTITDRTIKAEIFLF